MGVVTEQLFSKIEVIERKNLNGQPNDNVLSCNIGWSDISLFFPCLSSRAQQQNRNMDHIKVYCSIVFETKIKQNLNRDHKIHLIESNEFKILFNRGMQDQCLSVLDCRQLEWPKNEVTQYIRKTKSFFLSFYKSSENNIIMTFHFDFLWDQTLQLIKETYMSKMVAVILKRQLLRYNCPSGL